MAVTFVPELLDEVGVAEGDAAAVDVGAVDAVDVGC